MTLKTSQQVADQLGVTNGYLAKLRVIGDGPTYIKVGRSVRYRAGDIDAWLDARRVGSTSEQVTA